MSLGQQTLNERNQRNKRIHLSNVRTGKKWFYSKSCSIKGEKKHQNNNLDYCVCVCCVQYWIPYGQLLHRVTDHLWSPSLSIDMHPRFCCSVGPLFFSSHTPVVLSAFIIPSSQIPPLCPWRSPRSSWQVRSWSPPVASVWPKCPSPWSHSGYRRHRRRPAWSSAGRGAPAALSPDCGLWTGKTTAPGWAGCGGSGTDACGGWISLQERHLEERDQSGLNMSLHWCYYCIWLDFCPVLCLR